MRYLISEESSDVVVEKLDKLPQKREHHTEIYGMEIKEGECVQVVMGKYVYIGTVISIVFGRAIIIDIFDKERLVNLNKAWSLTKIDCNDLDTIKERLLAKKKKKKKEGDSE